MNDRNETNFDPQLLDEMLGQLDEQSRREIAARPDSHLKRARHEAALRAPLKALALERDRQPMPRAGLKDRIRNRIRSTQPVRGTAPADFDDGPVIIRLQTFRDIAAVAAVIVLAIGLGIPGMLEMRERARRVVCSDHLARVGAGLQSYALESNDQFPFVGWNQASSWRPSQDPDAELLPNRRHIYPLLTVGHVAPGQLICPSADDVPMQAELVPQRDDFVEARNVSFAYQNMAGARPTLESDASLPIMGDDNPLFENGWPMFDAVRRLRLGNPADANSRVHGAAGQNVLTRGGSVEWHASPNINNDNIWTLRNVDEYTGREGPRSTRDSHMLK